MGAGASAKKLVPHPSGPSAVIADARVIQTRSCVGPFTFDIYSISVEDLEQKTEELYSEVCVVAGTIYLAPECADKMLVYDTGTQQMQGIDVSDCGSSKGRRFSGICEVAGSIVLAPWNAQKMLSYNLTTCKIR
eukprot:4019547-Amphidinium_carterae.1